MDKPKVYFMDARSESPDTSLINKTVTVFEAAGFDKMINKGDVVAIKMHCGELGSSAYIRPAYVRAIADKIKELSFASSKILDNIGRVFFFSTIL